MTIRKEQYKSIRCMLTFLKEYKWQKLKFASNLLKSKSGIFFPDIALWIHERIALVVTSSEIRILATSVLSMEGGNEEGIKRRTKRVVTSVTKLSIL